MSLPNAQRRAAVVALRIAGGVAGGAVLWWVVATVFSSDRGIDFTDEGLYFLAADPPSKTARWVTPFGWSTAPFFRLVGHDIAQFRTLGVWLAVIVGGSLGWAIARWLTEDDPDRRWGRACRGGLAIVGATGAPFVVSSLLRTPSYNWVNLLGLMVGATGTILAATLPRQGPNLLRNRRAHAAAGLVALGAVFAAPAKPTSVPLLFLAAALLLGAQFDRRRLLEFAALVAVWGVGIVIVVVSAGFWPLAFLSTLWRSAQFPPMHPNQTVPGALKDVLRTPKVAWRELAHLQPAAGMLVLAGAIGAVVLNRRQRGHWLLRCLPLLLAVIAAVGTEVPWPVIGGPGAPERFAWSGTANAAVLLLAAAGLHLLANWRLTERTDRRRALMIAAFTIVLAVTFSFGSAMGVYHQMGLVATFLWLSAAVVVAATGRGSIRRFALGAVALASVTMATANIVDSRHHPYRGVDIAQQTTPVTVGPHGATLLVDNTTASFIDRVESSGRAAGFCTGTPLIGMAWSWSSTVPYLLGARVPDELILMIFGYAGADPTVLDVTMRYVHGPRWRDAWVLTTDPSTITPKAANELRAALDRLPAAIGRTFPADYTLAFDVDGTQLWRPTDVAVGCPPP